MPAPSAPLPHAGGLAPYRPSSAQPWNERRAAHLLRRTGFGLRTADVRRVSGLPPAEAVARLIAEARSAPLAPAPAWATARPPQRPVSDEAMEAFRDLTRAGHQASHLFTYEEAAAVHHPATPLREKLALAWHARIPVRQTHNARHTYLYWDLLRRHAFGSYRDLIREMGTTPTMLTYLDGLDNRATAPNENYARELLELFTMGVTGPDGRPNYTQRDVSELARAFTGWTTARLDADASFRPRRHDAGEKTIFGVTGPFDAETAVDLLFRERADAISLHVARHVYRTFVHAEPQPEVVAEMAARLRRDDFEMAGTLEALFSSAHFFADTTLGALIKSPLDHGIGLAVDLGGDRPERLLNFVRARAAFAGFTRMGPPDVGGWPGGREWIDTTRLTQRWLSSDAIVDRSRRAGPLLADVSDPDDPSVVTREIVARFLAVPLDEAAMAEAEAVLLGGIPRYEWRADADGAAIRVADLIKYLCRLPEYQLV